MSLLNLQTDLKSLKFGVGPSYDRPGKGNSGQPYITSPIPPDNPPSPGTVLDQINDFLTPTPNSPDFLLRGGISAARDTATDVLRLGKFFSNLNSSAGVSFVAKQNSLSQIAVRTQAGGKIQNEGAYTPLSTLTQAGINFVGGHVKKQSGITKYLDITSPSLIETSLPGEISNKVDTARIIPTSNNRLAQLYETKILNKKLIDPFTKETSPTLLKLNSISTLSGELISYNGGPGSTLGIGNTIIPIAKDNRGAPLQTGRNNIKLQNMGFFPPIITSATRENTDPTNLPPTRPTPKPQGLSGFDAFTIENQRKFFTVGEKSNSITDFRQDLYDIQGRDESFVTGIAPAYNNPKKTIDGPAGSRINYTSPGQKGNVINYQIGKIIDGGKVSVVDKINFQPLYQSRKVKSENDVDKNDLVKFRIAAVLRTGKKTYMHFRAYINSFSDDYSSNWDSIKYMGRGEDFYKYNGFGRKISLSFTVAAQSKPELMAQYKKLNYLASTLAPDYGDSGYMGGVMTTLTLGGWCYELPGFINSLNLDVPEESPWEIAIPANDEGADKQNEIFSNKSVKEMPHIVNVSMEYTPIHTFRPELQKNGYGSDKTPNGTGEVTKYGDQRYLSLSNALNNNYVPVDLAKAETPNSKQST
jgi:hypothetical protein